METDGRQAGGGTIERGGRKERQGLPWQTLPWQYLPWLFLLLGAEGFSALLLWIADAQAFRALAAVMTLAAVLLWAAVCGVLVFRERRRERAFLSFLDTPDEYHEEQLLKAAGSGQRKMVRLLGAALRERQSEYQRLQARLEEYEEYVESWAHETKMPLTLLTLLLDNRREELPEAAGRRLDYIRNRMQESIDQMLFYARVKGARKDYLFEHLEIVSCIEEVLEDYQPLLEERHFQVAVPDEGGLVYTDRRGLRFLLCQLVSNAVKYSGENPELCFDYACGDAVCVLCVRDNGMGVRSCDLPYIFEKGFTGGAGEDGKKATGMGLYLAKEIAGDLNATLEAASSWGEGFEMRIVFPAVEAAGE